jgi:hypothetical protein
MLGSVRWPILLLLSPLFVVLAGLTGSGGWAMFVAVSLLVVFWGLLNDASQLERARNPRLGLSWDRYDWSAETVVGLRTVVGGLALAAGLVLLIVSPAVGLWALGAWLVLLLLCWLETKLDGQQRYWMVELVIPLASAIVPTLVVAQAVTASARVSARAAAEATGGAEAAVVPTLLTDPGIGLLALLSAFVLGGLVLLCLIRDEVADRASGYRTTATSLGRTGGLVMLALWQIGGLLIAGVGVQAGAWLWPVPVLMGTAAIGTNWLLSARADGLSVTLWWLVGTAAVWVSLIH